MEDVSISVNGVSHPILCGLCHKPIAFIGEADPQTGQAGCADCSNVADVQEVARLAVEYAKDEAQLMLNRAAKEAARKSKIMTFKGQTSHDKAHRFIVDLKL